VRTHENGRAPLGARLRILVDRLIWPFRVVAGLALLWMMAVTVADVIGRHAFNAPIAGVVDMVEFTLVWCVFIGFAVAFASGAHISVDIIDSFIPPRALSVLMLLNGLVAAAIVTLLARLAVIQFFDKLDWGDSSIDLNIPLTWHWTAIALGYGVSLVVIVLLSAGILAETVEKKP
jgi:TRAP-type C4-dicarboxylate transport system permease small subunit